MRRLLALVVAAGCGADPRGDPPDAAPPARYDAGPADAAEAGFRVQYVDPDHGPFVGGTEVTIRGNGFADSDQVWIGGRRVLEQEHVDERRIRIVTPPGEPGGADVEVRKESGEIAVDPGGFTFDALALDPASGSIAGGTLVTIYGYGTDFGPGTTATLDGLPLTSIAVQAPDVMTGLTPPGTVGDAELIVVTDGAVHELPRAFTYFTTGDPFAGGMSGGPIAGTLNVVVLDNWTRDGLPGAHVVVGDPATSPYQGTTDALGQITFSGADLIGPVTVTATAADHEVASFHCFDAANLTIFLRSPLPPPDTGPPGPGPLPAKIRGHVLFGSSTGQGTPHWPLVPEPRTPTEVKRIYVTTSAPSIFSSPYPPVAPIDHAYDPDTVAWAYEVEGRAGAYAVVALAGLYDPARDPDGTGVVGFEPFALGVTRGVLVGPGEVREAVDVVVDVPLDAAARILLDQPPALGTEGQLGPTEAVIKAFVDLGSDGAIAFGRHGLPYVFGEPQAGAFPVPPGADEVLITDAPPRFSTIGGATYTVQAGAFTGGASPFSVRIERAIPALGALAIGDFLGVPRPTDPVRDGTATGRAVHFTVEGSDRPPTFHLHNLTRENGEPIWRGVTCGGLRDVELTDLSGVGVDWPPHGERLVWTVWSIEVLGGDYRQWTYRWNSANYWRAYAAEAIYVHFP